MGSLFCCCASEPEGNYHSSDTKHRHQSSPADVPIEVRREQALEAAEKRQKSNQQRGVGHTSNLEARQKRLEKEERKAILSGQANQPGGLTWKVD